MSDILKKYGIQDAIEENKNLSDSSILKKYGVPEDEEKAPSFEKPTIYPDETFAIKALGPFADEGIGAAMGVRDYLKNKYPDLKTAYRVNRDAARGAFKSAGEQNPKSAIAGNVAHAGATMVVPGGQAAKGVGFFGKVVQGALNGAASGGYYGAGESEADLTRGQYSQFAGDTYDAAKTGALYGGATSGLLATPAAFKKSVVPTANRVLFGVPKDVSRRYMERPDAVRNAKTLVELADDLPNKIKNIGDDVAEFSDEAVATLSNNRAEGIPIRAVLDQLDEASAVAVDKEKLNILNEVRKDIMSAYTQRMGSIDGSRYAQNLTEKEFKNALKKVGAQGEFLKNNLHPDQAAVNMAYGKLSNILKTKNPLYKSTVESVRDRINLKNKMVAKYGLEKQVGGKFEATDRTIGALKQVNKENRIEKARALEQLKGLGYGNAKDEVLDTLANATFDQRFTNGSRNVNLWGALGYGLGKATDIKGAGAAAGAAVGSAVDAYGPKIAKHAVLDPIIWMTKNITKLKSSPNGQKYITPLMEAAKRGNQSFAATYYLMSMKHPDFQSEMEKLNK